MAAAKASHGDVADMSATRRSPMVRCAHVVVALAVAWSAVCVACESLWLCKMLMSC